MFLGCGQTSKQAGDGGALFFLFLPVTAIVHFLPLTFTGCFVYSLLFLQMRLIFLGYGLTRAHNVDGGPRR